MARPFWLERIGVVLLALGGVSGLPQAGAAPKTTSKANGRLHVVKIENMKFDPPELTVKVGDSVEWINLDLFPHTATADNGAFDSSGVPPEKKWRWKVSKVGDLSYICRFHPTMVGKITAE